MREIKFRGKRVDNGEWVYGSYHWSANGKYHYILNLEKFNERPHPNGVRGVDEMCLFRSEVNEADPSTVGQYTGLKDKNGKDIYEGDILSFKHHGGYLLEDCLMRVAFDIYNGCFGYYSTFGLFDDTIIPFTEHDELQEDILNHAEIIGNIHGNPELLK